MNADTRPDPATSPWHAGEVEIQQRLGVAERMDTFGRRVIRDHMPDQHRTFYAQLPFLLVGTVDPEGRPWASLFEGRPGFVRSPDPRTLDIGAGLGAEDPAAAGLAPGAALGLLGIELHTRRRNRMNGRIAGMDASGLRMAVGQSFGNCPQYIQTRDFRFVREPGAFAGAPAAEHGQGLDADARASIAAADTFFVASYVDPDGDAGRRGVDVSHRGGRPGFVRIEGDTLTIPDFAGNLHFNTLGNLLINPRAGLLFLDFESGDVLQLTGRTELVFDGPEVETFQGAERLWRLHVERWVRRRGALALRWQLDAFSPNSLMTGTWEEAEARRRADAVRHAWRPYRIARRVPEAQDIVSFELAPADDAGLPLHQAGQYLPIRVRLPGEAAPQVRTYTLSTAPSDGRFRISVKRDGKVSTHLHDALREGAIIEARAPDGRFLIDATLRRPAVLLAGGIGVTPMLAMARHLVYEGLRTRRMRPTWFLYATRNSADRAFEREIGELVQRAQGQLRVVRIASQPRPGEQAGVDHEIAGRPGVDLLKQVLPFDDHDFYLCGPAGFMQDLYDGLRDLRVPDDRIHAEAFGPAGLKRRPDAGVSAPTLPPASEAPVQVIFAGSGKEARWSPGDGPLLELAEARGLEPVSSCRAGHCGSCRVRVEEGAVTYAEPPAAGPAPGEALLCQAVPAAGGRLILAL